MSSRAVVIGGGLAGIACALDCADAGAQVTLVEVRRRLGGAAYSFEREGVAVDNGQHVFLRCCSDYRGLLERLGSSAGVRLQDSLEIPVLAPGREPLMLRRGPLPAPLHLAAALLRYRHLSVAQRLAAARAAAALGRLDPQDGELERMTFGAWLRDHRQGERSLAALWDLIALPTLNLRADEASAALAAFVFQTGLLERADAGDIGFHELALSETIDVPARAALARAGVELKLGWRAERIVPAAAGMQVHGGADQELEADVVVVAVPHARAAGLIESLLPQTAGRLRRLASSPIVNIHVVYDRQVCDWRFAGGVDTPVQYLFDRSRAGGVPPGCQYLAISLSGAAREMQMSVDALRELYLPALVELLPRTRQAKLLSFFVTREHAATFRAAPGVQALRPPAASAFNGLVLAGTWTDTSWPATLEGAVRSGHTAAREALRALGGTGAEAASGAGARAGAGTPASVSGGVGGSGGG